MKQNKKKKSACSGCLTKILFFYLIIGAIGAVLSFAFPELHENWNKKVPKKTITIYKMMTLYFRKVIVHI